MFLLLLTVIGLCSGHLDHHGITSRMRDIDTIPPIGDGDYTELLPEPTEMKMERLGLQKENDTFLDTEYKHWEVCSTIDNLACSCQKKVLSCIHVIGEDDKDILDTAEVYIKKKDFVAQVVRFKDNALTRLKKGKIVPGHEQEVRTLDLAQNNIQSIQNGAFQFFLNLNILSLSHNIFQSINRDWFIGLDELKRLSLIQCGITELEENIFWHLRTLKSLFLDGNKLKLNKDSFRGLDGLVELSLDNCGLKSLPLDFFEHMPNLRILSLRGNYLTEIPKALGFLPSLVSLDISKTSLTEFNHYSLRNAIHLTHLYMDNMQYIHEIHDCAFCKAPNLTIVDMNNNRELSTIHQNAFGYLDDSYGKVEHLADLNIDSCNLKELHPKMIDYHNLDYFETGGNQWNCTCSLFFLVNEMESKNFNHFSPPVCLYPDDVKNRKISDVRDILKCEKSVKIENGSANFSWVYKCSFAILVFTIGYIFYRKLSRRGQSSQPHPLPFSYSNLKTSDDQNEGETDMKFRNSPTDV